MATEFTPVGTCKDTYGDEIIVELTGDGCTAVTFVRRTGEHFGMILDASQLAAFRNLLERAAKGGSDE